MMAAVRTLMANGVMMAIYIAGSLALLAGLAVLLSGPRPRSAARRTAGAALTVLGIVFVVPATILGIIATAGPPAGVPPSPTARPGENLISCATDGELPPAPIAPPAGCVIVVEWGEPGQPPTGLLATTGPVQVPDGRRGHWWYHSAASAAQHIATFRARYPTAPVDDRR